MSKHSTCDLQRDAIRAAPQGGKGNSESREAKITDATPEGRERANQRRRHGSSRSATTAGGVFARAEQLRRACSCGCARAMPEVEPAKRAA